MPELVVQMGHVARTRGATGTTGEQVFARQAAAEIAAEVRARAAGWTVRTIYADPVADRDYAGDAFVAIHCDGSVSPSARGASVGYRTPEGSDLGDRLLRAYAEHGWTGGFRDDNYTPALKSYYGVREAVGQGNRQAVIFEAGFLTNEENRDLLTGRGGAARVALALCDALGIVGRPDTPVEDDMITEKEFGRLSGDMLRQANKAVKPVLARLGALEAVIRAETPDGPELIELARQGAAKALADVDQES